MRPSVSKPARERSHHTQNSKHQEVHLQSAFVLHGVVFIRLCREFIYKEITMFGETASAGWPGGGERPQSSSFDTRRSPSLFRFRLGINIRTSWHALQLLWPLTLQILSSTQTFTSRSAQPEVCVHISNSWSCFLLSKINLNIRVYLFGQTTINDQHYLKQSVCQSNCI